jgi:hypothetical protein
MMFARTTKGKFTGSFNAILLFLAVGTCLCTAQAQGSVLGELKLEGNHIERLVLHRRDGRTEQFNEPAETIKLTIGEYRLQEVRLKGGFNCNSIISSTYNWVTVTEDESAVLKVGAPLKQMLEVKRRGKALVLDYKLLGIGGESYTKQGRNKPPRLIVYNGDEEINSGRFEYG